MAKEIRPEDVSTDLYLAQELDKLRLKLGRLERREARRGFMAFAVCAVYIYNWVK